MATDLVFRRLHALSEAAVWRLERITPREKLFMSITADVCQGTLGASFAAHVALAARHGVGHDDLREAIRFMAYDAGHHAALAAIQRLDELAGGAAEVAPAVLDELTRAAADPQNPFPDYVRGRLEPLGEAFAGFMMMQSRLRRASPLSQRERAFITMTIDVLYQTLDDTFAVHTMRALANGADRDTVREAVSFTALFGAARAWSALRKLDGAFAIAAARPTA